MSRIANDGHAAALTLELHAQRAGAALACVYSSSAEYDAALIAGTGCKKDKASLCGARL